MASQVSAVRKSRHWARWPCHAYPPIDEIMPTAAPGPMRPSPPMVSTMWRLEMKLILITPAELCDELRRRRAHAGGAADHQHPFAVEAKRLCSHPCTSLLAAWRLSGRE